MMTSQSTSADSKKRNKDPEMAPYLYTTKFNARQDLLFCGGAGKNEMRVYDWESGNIVANIGNLPKAITCGSQCVKSSMFCFGSVDSRLRLFNIETVIANSEKSEKSEKSSTLSTK
jgi:hypothetical protein